MRLTAKDKRVINDFIDRKSIGSHSPRIWTDGRTLGTHGLGGGPLARWSNNGTIEFNDRGTVSEQTIRRYILKVIPPRWVANESSWVLPKRSQRLSKRDPAATRGIKSDTFKQVVSKVRAYVRAQGMEMVGVPVPGARGIWQVAVRRPDAGSRATIITIPHTEIAKHARRTSRQRNSRSKSGRDPQSNINPVCAVGTQVQTVILSKNFFNQREAKSWIGRNDFRISKIDETANSWRFRQQPPDWFEKQTFRTIRLRPGVQAVIGCPIFGGN